MYCAQCGARVEPQANYCAECGTAVSSRNQQPALAIDLIRNPRTCNHQATSISAVYAGFWKRLAAFVIDIGVMLVPAIVTNIFLSAALGVDPIAKGSLVPDISALLVGWLYYASMESSTKQATLGKLALGIRAVDLRGSRLSFGRASGRFFAKLLSGMSLFVGYLIAAFTDKKQALHDIVAGTLIVTKSTALDPSVLPQPSPLSRDTKIGVGIAVAAVILLPLAIITAIAIPAYNTYIRESRLAIMRMELDTLRVAMETYRLDNKNGNYGPPKPYSTAFQITDTFGWAPVSGEIAYAVNVTSAAPPTYRLCASMSDTSDTSNTWMLCKKAADGTFSCQEGQATEDRGVVSTAQALCR